MTTNNEHWTPTRQARLPSGFDRTTTAEQVVAGRDLRGKLALVTGGYSGVGRATVAALVGAGARVIVPAKRVEAAASALAGLPGVEIDELDLIDPASIDRFAARVRDKHGALHLLINNAGIMAPPLVRDARGYESQLATNHLGHFQLTARLWPALVAAGGARVVALSSWGHRFAAVDFDDPSFERRDYDRWQAYGQSKTANALFAVALDRRGAPHGVRAFAVHPGRIITPLVRHMSADELRQARVIDEAGQPIASAETKTPAQGAATSVWCATSPALDGKGGVYCEDVDIAEIVQPNRQPAAQGLHDAAVETGVMPHAIDPEAAERLWALSERMTVAFAM